VGGCQTRQRDAYRLLDDEDYEYRRPNAYGLSMTYELSDRLARIEMIDGLIDARDARRHENGFTAVSRRVIPPTVSKSSSKL
jgi:hypothetical protein